MSDLPDVNAAYALDGSDEVRALYAAWANSYDAGFGEAQGYQIPTEIVRAFLGAQGTGPVLDVGAGTGLVGEALKAAGVGPVDALDLSPEMLEVARMKAIYRSHIAADVTQPHADLKQGHYAGIVSAGTFTLGHVGPEGLKPIVEMGAPNALFVISVNAAHYESAGFEAEMDRLSPLLKGRADRDIRIYDDRADASHRADLARLLIFRKA